MIPRSASILTAARIRSFFRLRSSFFPGIMNRIHEPISSVSVCAPHNSPNTGCFGCSPRHNTVGSELQPKEEINRMEQYRPFCILRQLSPHVVLLLFLFLRLIVHVLLLVFLSCPQYTMSPQIFPSVFSCRVSPPFDYQNSRHRNISPVTSCAIKIAVTKTVSTISVTATIFRFRRLISGP